MPHELRLLGLVVVAAEPGRRVPQLARERLDLVAGWVPAVYRMPWVALALGVDPDNVARCEPLHRAIPRELIDLIHATTATTRSS